MEKTRKPIIAGILDIIAGLLWIIGVIFLVLVWLGFSVGFGMPSGFNLVRLWLTFVGLGLIGVIAILGGSLALRRRYWLLTLIGSLCAVPMGLGIVATALIAISRREFK